MNFNVFVNGGIGSFQGSDQLNSKTFVQHSTKKIVMENVKGEMMCPKVTTPAS